MLRPQDSAARERKSLNGLWAFRLDAAGQGRSAGWFRGDLGGSREMAVPASFNDVVADGSLRNHVGDIWYQTRARVPRGWDGERIVLHFESATHRATVWVGDVEVVRHEGGYTPFEADITQHAIAGQELRVTVLVNNALSFQSIPPGVIEDTAVGRRQRYFHDFFNYSGIHRNVWLYATPRAYIDDITVDTGLDGSSGTVSYSVVTEGTAGHQVQVVLRRPRRTAGRERVRWGGDASGSRRPCVGARGRLPL
jgi:beta-glucuronidase